MSVDVIDDVIVVIRNVIISVINALLRIILQIDNIRVRK